MVILLLFLTVGQVAAEPDTATVNEEYDDPMDFAVIDNLIVAGGDVRMNVTGSPYEVFTDWTEVDAPGRLTQTATRSTFTNLARDDDAVYLYDDKTGLIQNFVLNFTVKVTDIDSSTSKGRASVIMIADTLDSYIDNLNNLKVQYGLSLRGDASTAQWYLLLVETWGGTQYKSGAEALNLNVGGTYYVRMVKSGTSLTAAVDDNADFSSPVETFSLTLHANHNLPYVMCPQAIKYASALYVSGYVEYLDMGFGGAGSGYLQSNEVSNYNFTLDYVMANVTLNAGTLEFRGSGDGGTSWGSWVPLAASTHAGYTLTGDSLVYEIRMKSMSTSPILYSLDIVYKYDYALAMFTELLWGSGAFIGHIVIIVLLLAVKRFFGSIGGFVSFLGSVGMMLLVFNTMPVNNPAYLMVIGYLAVVFISVINIGGTGRRYRRR